MADQIIDIPGVGPVAFPDSMSESEITAAAATLHSQSQAGDNYGNVNPATVGAADLTRRVAVRAGEQIATSPNLSRVVGVMSKPAAGAVARSVGVVGGLKGYVLGEALSNPSVGRTVEAGLRGGSGLLARMAASPIARAITGLPGMLASMPLSEAGDRPYGETAETTAARQVDFERQYREIIGRNYPPLPSPPTGFQNSKPTLDVAVRRQLEEELLKRSSR